MTIFILGLLVFFGVHVVRIVAPGLRERAIASRGLGPWKGLYALLSLLGLALIIWGWSLYRQEAPQIYTPPEWGRHVTMLLVLIGFILVFASHGPVGHIKASLHHPMLIGVFLWGVGHLLANGDLASILLFGAFAAYCVIDLVAAVQRPAIAPGVASVRGDMIAVIAGVLAYAVFLFWLHGLLFGVSPLG